MNSLIIAMGLLSIDEPEHVFVHDDLSEYEPSLKRAKLSNDNNFDKPFVVPKFDALTVQPVRQYNFGVNFYRDLDLDESVAIDVEEEEEE